MLGTFQSSTLRLEVDASAETLRECLINTDQLRQWLWPQELVDPTPEQLDLGTEFKASIGPIVIDHRVETLEPTRIRLILWGPLDGYTEWAWGNGWVQLRLEAVCPVPLIWGQQLTLKQLCEFAQQQETQHRS